MYPYASRECVCVWGGGRGKKGKKKISLFFCAALCLSIPKNGKDYPLTFKFTYKATDTDRQKTSAKGQIISNANKLFSVQIK